MHGLLYNWLEFAATFRRSLDDDEHGISFSEHGVDRHLDHPDDHRLDDQDHQYQDHPDVLLLQHPHRLDDQHHRHRKEVDRLDHLDVHLDRLDVRHPEPKDA